MPDKDLAQGLLSQLQAAGYPAFLIYQNGLYQGAGGRLLKSGQCGLDGKNAADRRLSDTAGAGACSVLEGR